MTTIRISVLALVFVAQNLSAQFDSAAFKNNDHFFRVVYDNDLFSGTDRYYTQGVIIEMSVPALSAWPLSKILVPLNKLANNYYWSAFEQDCFTPKSIRRDTVNRFDRPYAALLYYSRYLLSMNDRRKQRLSTRLDLGVIGPLAGGRETQTAIHRATNNDEPLGWQHQLKNDLLLNYSLAIEQGLLVKRFFETTVFGKPGPGQFTTTRAQAY
jgi:lipid A 3-O-deacylase